MVIHFILNYIVLYNYILQYILFFIIIINFPFFLINENVLVESVIHGRFIARIMSFDDNQLTVCNYKHFRPLFDNHLLLPIHNTYTKFEVHLNNLAHDTNTFYNIVEVYLESYRYFKIYVDDIVDTVLVLTIN